MPGKRPINPNPKYATQPGIVATQHERNDRRGSLSSVTASPAPATTPLRHGVVSPAQKAHDTSKLMLDLLARVVKVEAEVAGLKEENGSLKEELSQEKKERKRIDKEMEKLRNLNKQMVEGKEDVHSVRSVVETLMNDVEKNVLRSGVEEAMKTMEAETREMKRAAAEVMDRLEDDRRKERKEESKDAQRRSDGTHVKEVKKKKKRHKMIILTDSNGREVTEERIRCHMPREDSEEVEVEVVVAYTLFEVCQKLRRGEIEVRGAVVILDVTTNDVRGTRASPQTSPAEIAERAGTTIDLLAKRGCEWVVICEVKPMRHMDVAPYSYALHLKSLEKGTFGCRNQIREEDLGNDGFHLKRSSLSILEKTYACAVLGVPVPCPAPPGLEWRQRQRQYYEEEWPMTENVWDARMRRRKEQRSEH